MSDKFLLTGRVICYVRHMTPEEMDREDWIGPPPVALVLDNGAVVYAGVESADLESVPGQLLAQHEGLMWNLMAEAERQVARNLARNILRRTRAAALLIAALLSVLALASVVLGLAVDHHSWTHIGPGVAGQLLTAGVCLVLANLVQASISATQDPKHAVDQMVDQSKRKAKKARS